MENIFNLVYKDKHNLERKRLDWMRIIWMLLNLFALFFVLWQYGEQFNIFETIIFIGTIACIFYLGNFWVNFRYYLIIVVVLALTGINFFSGNYSTAEQNFFLKYLLSSQSATSWMSFLLVIATLTYGLGLFNRNKFVFKLARSFTWLGAIFGLVAMLVRWYESYLINTDYGHIPVSSLYEVFILFIVMTSLIYLFYEERFKIQSLGFFALSIVASAVVFTLWYSVTKDAHLIQPLVPALKSYWMKIHVPANFVGYGAFSIAAMLSIVYLIKNSKNKANWIQKLPDVKVLDDLLYRLIALGFAFFTLATVLGALWAAEAWGGYWSWDPKETWSLIVWLNYAAWLHLRFTKGVTGNFMAWWAIFGLLITTFAFLGVNMFLSGLHSYGEL